MKSNPINSPALPALRASLISYAWKIVKIVEALLSIELLELCRVMLYAMDSVARVSMLRRCIKLAETTDALYKNDCVWLFALCAAVDAPLDADTCAALRGLLRKCASLRAGKSELDDEVIMLNILATISGYLIRWNI